MSFKVVLSKPTFQATDTNPDNLIFSSDYDTLKYDTLGSISLTLNYADYYHVEPDPVTPDNYYYNRKVVEFTHDLGYIPFFSGYLLDLPDPGDAVQCPFLLVTGLNSFVYVAVYADSTKLYFLFLTAVANVNSGSTTLDFKFRLFKNDLNI